MPYQTPNSCYPVMLSIKKTLRVDGISKAYIVFLRRKDIEIRIIAENF
jgi:hypothetical protein